MLDMVVRVVAQWLPISKGRATVAVDGWLAVAEAAAELEVSKSRVRQLLAEGVLSGRKVGAQILVDQGGIRRRAAHRPAAGRPLGPQLAWAALAALSADRSIDVAAHGDRNLRHRLNALLRSSPSPDRWRMLLCARARPQRCWAHPAVIAELLADKRVSVGGARAAARSGLNISAGDDVVVYAAQHDVPALLEYYALEDDPHGPVELRAVPAAAGDFAPRGGVAVPLAAAVFDLLDADDSRLRHAAREWLEHSATRRYDLGRHDVQPGAAARAAAG